MFARGAGPARQPVHLLQQVPGQRRREPARLLRRDAVRVARRDDRADHVGLRAAAVPAEPLDGEQPRMTRAHVAIAGLLLMLGATRLGGGAQRIAQDDILSHFKYGSVGTEETRRPAVPDLARAAGPLRRQAAEPPRQGLRAARIHLRDATRRRRPIGTTYVEDRVPLVGLNCATCHAGTVREAPASAAADHPRHAGAPDGPAGLRATSSPRARRTRASTRRHLIEAIRKQDPEFSWFNSLLYRFVVVKRTRDGHPRARRAERLVRRSAAAGSGPRRHLQSVQADVRAST